LRRNCLIKDVIEGKEKGKMEVTERRGRKHEQLLDDLKKKRVLELELSRVLPLEEVVDMSLRNE
jgi:hypothetical protein